MRRLGSAVTLVDRGARLLQKELPRYGRLLEGVFADEGVDVRHGTEVAAFRGPSTAVLAPSGKTDGGSAGEVDFDECLVAIGRDESVRDMDLGRAGIEVDGRGVLRVDDAYRTTNPHVFAVGDAVGREKFSHAAEMHNRDLIVNLLSPVPLRRHSLARFSWVTFTDPEVATFGLTADELDARAIDFETIDQPFADDDRAVAGGYADRAHLTLYVAPGGPGRAARVLGGSMIAPGAGELVQEWVLALQSGATLNDVFNKVYAYPVASRINQKAAFTYRRGGLGEEVKGAIRWWWRVMGRLG